MPDNAYLVFITGTILIIFLCVAIIVFVILYTRTQLRFQVERRNFRQALLESEVEIRNVTLDMIARDLHDNLGQIASLIKINLNLLQSDQTGSAPERLTETRELVSTLIGGMRDLTSHLHNHDMQERDLPQMIMEDVRRMTATGVFAVDLKVEGCDALTLHADISLFLYRMFQEMMHNVLKHAQAKRVNVYFRCDPAELQLRVKDDGRGFQVGEGEGNGLRNIRERCRLINAELKVSSRPGEGTELSIRLPLKNLK